MLRTLALSRFSRYLTFVGLLLLTAARASEADVVALDARQDNTIYQSGQNNASNGVGDYLFTGRTNQGEARRALLEFDIAGNVPPGATINSASLRLYMSRASSSTNRATSLHVLLADWGEGTSDAGGQEGAGGEETEGASTWFYRYWPSLMWTNSGGDYVATASATTNVGGFAFHTWTSSTMATDVRNWRDTPSSNHGWILIGTEGGSTSSKRFDSSENDSLPLRPKLTINFTPQPGLIAGACCLSNGSCIILRPADCDTQNGTYQGDNTTCTSHPCSGVPVTVTLSPTRDNTLYEDANGTLSNGAGEFFFTGRVVGNPKRRGVLGFDLAGALPPGAVVSAAALTLRTTQGGAAANNVSLYRALKNWGEGTSDASGDESAGAPATTSDATWKHTLYPSSFWTNLGGDYVPTPSATTLVAFEAFYNWSSAGMVSDLQHWIDHPSEDFGWVIAGVETGGVPTIKRFASRQHTQPLYRPELEITYSVPPPQLTGACCIEEMCEVLTAAQCTNAGGTYLGDDMPCHMHTCAIELEPYVDALPIPSVAAPVSGVPGGTATYEIPIVEVEQQLHRDLPPTRLWTYAGTFPGPTIEARSGLPVTVNWVSDLRDEGGQLRTTHLLPVDECLHGPDSLGASPRTVVHLHGGHVPADSDGYPEDTILPGEEQTFFYPNEQPASTLWYHDHALGITRLNVALGLAAFYIVRDATEDALNLPDGEYEIPLAIQDRSFHGDGMLQYPATWEEHWFGDKVLVNGKVWPYLQVKRGSYRFRVLNGSNSRTYTLALSNGASFTVIGGDGGLLEEPVVRDSLTLSPAERADLVINFAGYAPGTQILLENSAPAPFPNGDEMHPQVTDVMKFIVQSQSGVVWNPPGTLQTIEHLAEEDATVERDFMLEKMPDDCTGGMWMINGMHWDDITEYPELGATEIWRFINRSAISHPMHLHLVMFQMLDRQAFTVVGDSVVANGPRIPPDPTQAGWKDTIPVLPNEMVRVIARFEDYTGRFAYHCHILEHEDQMMMRQFEVVDNSSTLEPGSAGGEFRLWPSRPNPTSGPTQFSFQIPAKTRARIDLFDVGGRRVATVLDRLLEPGKHAVSWDGSDASGRALSPGIYFYRLTLPGREEATQKMVFVE